MHAFPMHIEKGNQENDRFTCTKLYRIQRDESRTRARDRSSVIVRWGNPICVYYVLLCEMICEWNPTCVYYVLKCAMICGYELFILVGAMAMNEYMNIDIMYDIW